MPHCMQCDRKETANIDASLLHIKWSEATFIASILTAKTKTDSSYLSMLDVSCLPGDWVNVLVGGDVAGRPPALCSGRRSPGCGPQVRLWGWGVEIGGG